jgi:hypothetical protein
MHGTGIETRPHKYLKLSSSVAATTGKVKMPSNGTKFALKKQYNACSMPHD